MKTPQECSNITEVRNEIDRIDKAVINLLSQRAAYVHEVVKYKDPTPQGIEAIDRRQRVLDSRRQWAQMAGFDPDVVEDLYVRLIDYFIEEEKKLVQP